ncbi:glycosyltransferase family 4 protein [Planomicrobium okeanokoites]|uniref:Glycosyltransferase family 4 protein n=1 Tax=Planomicrobium okeanokoites TaxID=244 RepID=A0ABV7KN82_PLAOK|nr:glycosyltransferase family 4 protein [Planomicrobium okeanokoites]TAA66079.1 glycosyltransferase WbuB [Planomicrobium okeanokoites]
MNIWILNHYAVAPRTIGGTRHYDLASQLIKEGHRVRIFASSFNHFERRETVTYKKENFIDEIIDDVIFTWIKTPPYGNPFKRLINISVFSFRLNKIMKDVLKREIPDLIIGSSVHPLTALIGLKNSKKVESLFYFEERDLWPQTFIDFGIISEKNIVSKVLFSIEKKLYRESDRVIFLFEKAHKYAISKGLYNKKPIYLPNGYNAERVSHLKESSELNGVLNTFENKKLCMYVGSFGEANHLTPLIELVEKMKEEKEYHFLFVGGGALKAGLIDSSQKLDLQNITFLDPIPKEQIPFLLSHAHCGLISMKDSPLYNWGFSMNKIYDYLSLGLPIIAYSNLKDLGNLENTQGIINSDSLDFLKEGITNASEIDREAIKNFAYDHYSWNILNEGFLKIVNSDIKSHKENSGVLNYEKNI